jgi:hypothetical protein
MARSVRLEIETGRLSPKGHFQTNSAPIQNASFRVESGYSMSAFSCRPNSPLIYFRIRGEADAREGDRSPSIDVEIPAPYKALWEAAPCDPGPGLGRRQ